MGLALLSLGVTIVFIRWVIYEAVKSEKRDVLLQTGKANFASSFYFLIFWYWALIFVRGSGSICTNVFGVFLAVKESLLSRIGMILMFYVQWVSSKY